MLHTYTYSFTDPSSAQVGLNVEIVMKRSKLQYAIKSNKLYIFFWVFPRRQIVVGRRFGTLYQFHLQRLGVQCEV